MMNKRGLIHVDWALSMGLFLIYITVLFIIIKPGYFVANRPEDLFTIVNNNLIKIITVNIKEVQFSAVCKESSVPGEIQELKLYDDAGKYKFTKLVDKDGTDLSEFSGVNLGDELKITCLKPPNGKEIISKETLVATSPPRRQIDFSDSVNLPKYLFLCRYDHSSQGKKECEGNLGIISTYTGFSERYLQDLAAKPYEEIRNSWGFPSNSKFKIEVIKGENTKVAEISDKTEPPQNKNVYVKEFQNIFLDDKNNREKEKVRIIIW